VTEKTMAYEEQESELENEVENQIRENIKSQTGEWAICSALVFLGVVLVLVLGHLFEAPREGVQRTLELSSTLPTIFTFDVGAEFPVDIAVVILLISIMSAFSALISLVADKNNARTWLLRVFTLGPLLPIFFSIVMMMLISNNYNDESIIQEIIGTTEVIELRAD